MIKVLHVITGLEIGGAEHTLEKIVTQSDKDAFSMSVVSLTHLGQVGRRIRRCGVKVLPLGMKRGIPDPRAWSKLREFVLQSKPDVIHSWMAHANLLSALAAPRPPWPPIIWGIRGSDLRTARAMTKMATKSCGWLSHRIPQRIVCCSEAGKRDHLELGYSEDKMLLIPNGFSLDTFRPNDESRRSVRLELRLPEDTLMVGRFGRFHPMKDYETFLDAAARLSVTRNGVHFLLCGKGVESTNLDLARKIKSRGLEKFIHLLGIRDDLPRLTASLDVMCSSSCSGEGFPNVLGEAMASGVPCVGTDVGDSALLMGPTGKLVPPGDCEALASALESILQMSSDGRRKLGAAARERIRKQFEISTVVRQYQDLYAQIAELDGGKGLKL